MYEDEDQGNGVLQFLKKIDQEKYWDIFKAKGYDRESDIEDLDDDDMEHMHISGDDRADILQAGRHTTL